MRRLAIDEIVRIVGNNYSFVMNVSRTDGDILSSISQQLNLNGDLTFKQRALITKLIDKHSSAIVSAGVASKEEMDWALESPTFYSRLRKMITQSSVVIDEESSRIKLSFPFDKIMIEKIKSYRTETSSVAVSYNATTRTWDFPIREEHIQFISSTFVDLDADEKFSELSAEIKKIIANFEQYLPIIELKNDSFQYKNTAPTLPQCTETSLIPALLHARKHGIFSWDDNIDTQLESHHNERVNNFFRNSSNRQVDDGGPFTEYAELIKGSKAILLIIPGGNEYSMVHELRMQLNQMGITDSEMSVYFRLEGKDNLFNQYVKNNALNANPLIDDTLRAIFISGKPSKKLIDSKRYFDVVFQFGNEYADYKAKHYAAAQPNVVRITHQ